MKYKTYLLTCLPLILLSTFYACSQSNDPQQYIGTALDTRAETAPIDTTKFNAEYIDYSTVQINGKLPLESKYAEFLKVLGKPDSVVNFNPDTDCQFYLEPYQYIYLKGGMFYLVNDTAIFQQIDFRTRPDVELKTPAITLNGKTTLQEVKRLYPKAVSKIRSTEDPKTSHLRLVELGEASAIMDEWWILFFEGDKLVMVELFSPC